MHDFKVKPISDVDGETLFLKVEPLLYKFVWLNERESHNRLEQFLVLRHELAAYLLSHLDYGSPKGSWNLVNNDKITFIGGLNSLRLECKIRMSNTTFPVSDESGLFISTLLKDVELLRKNEKKMNKNSIDHFISSLFGEFESDQDIWKKMTRLDLEILLFEHSLMKRRKNRPSSMSNLYQVYLKGDFADTKPLLQKLLINFEYIYENQECDCGSDGCFFDILKSNQTHYFKGDYHHVEGGIDNEKVTRDFESLWEGLSEREKTALLYLYQEFENSTLLNLAFLKSDFDLYKYQHLMCFPYQPDDPSDFMVRTVSTLANHFIRIDEASRPWVS